MALMQCSGTAQDAHLGRGACPHCSPAASMAALTKLCPASVSAALTLQRFRPTCERTHHAQQATPDANDSTCTWIARILHRCFYFILLMTQHTRDMP